ncbi:vWA domain-containing protein [Streptomyces daliensis]
MSTAPTAPPALLRGVDRAAFAVALGVRLRAYGVPVGFTRVEDFVRSLALAPPRARSELYWTARVCLVRAHAELPAFDAVFAAVFDGAVLGTDPHARRTAPRSTRPQDDTRTPPPHSPPGTAPTGQRPRPALPWATRPVVPQEPGEPEGLEPATVPERLPSALAALADVPFGRLGPDSTALLGQWLRAATRAWPTRRTRRYAPARGGRRIVLRPTIARARRTGWEPVRLVRADPVHRPRRVVMLCDVSRSMQPQAVAYLHLMHALARHAEAEVFAFSTSLTRLTPALAQYSAREAVDRATEQVTDRFGGTRIASSLRTLLASHHGGALRGALVIVASDGWDADAPRELATAMARLRRRAHRVIWVNPRAGAPDFEARVAAMAAALPHCDALLPGDTFRALAAVIAEITR